MQTDGQAEQLLVIEKSDKKDGHPTEINENFSHNTEEIVKNSPEDIRMKMPLADEQKGNESENFLNAREKEEAKNDEISDQPCSLDDKPKVDCKKGRKKIKKVASNENLHLGVKDDQSVSKKKKKHKKKLSFSSRKKTKAPVKSEKIEANLGKRAPKNLNDGEMEEKDEVIKPPKIGRVMRNEKLINEYRKKILAEANQEYIGRNSEEEDPMKPQKIQFNPMLKVLTFAKLVRRSLSDRLSKPEQMSKECQFKSVLKGSSSTFNSTVRYTDLSMFPNKNEVFEHALIDHEDIEG